MSIDLFDILNFKFFIQNRVFQLITFKSTITFMRKINSYVHAWIVF